MTLAAALSWKQPFTVYPDLPGEFCFMSCFLTSLFFSNLVGFLVMYFCEGKEVVAAFFSWLFNFEQAKDVGVAEALIWVSRI